MKKRNSKDNDSMTKGYTINFITQNLLLYMKKRGVRNLKRKGFTLIELLAVIVILAIISLIATPMIMDVIEKARKGSAESSATGYINAVENYMVMAILDTNYSLTDGTYTMEQLNTYKIDVKGEKPSAGTITITSSKIEDYELKIGEYVVKYDKVKKKAVAEKKEYEEQNKNIKQVVLNDGSRWYIIEENETTATLFSMYNINTTTNKQDSSLTGNEDDIHAVQFDDGTRNNENNTFCQLTDTNGIYHGCSAYEAVEGLYQSHSNTTDNAAIEQQNEGTVTEDSNIKKYIDTYVNSLNLGENLVSYGLLSWDTIKPYGCFYSEPGAGSPGNRYCPLEFMSTRYWISVPSKVIVGYNPYQPGNSEGFYSMESIKKSGVRPMIVVKKNILQ